MEQFLYFALCSLAAVVILVIFYALTFWED